MSERRHDVVTAVLVRDGRVLLCHRHPNREWYPNVWDVPGGHIEPGESPAEAVRRELHEELGIDVRLDGPEPFRTLKPSDHLRLRAWVVTEWDGEIENRSTDEHDEIGWFDVDQLRHLDLADDQVGKLLVDILEPLGDPAAERSAEEVRQHLTVVFAETDLPELARLRHHWDPVMASGVPPHLTVVYPEEVDDFDDLLDRARRIIPQAEPFQMCLGAATSIDEGAGGVFVDALDESSSLASLRTQLLPHGSVLADFRAHVTVAHPRTSASGPDCWRQLAGWSANVDVSVSQIAFTQTSTSTGMHVVETFPLG